MAKSYKVLITTSGVGTLLGEFVKYTNKTLIKVGRRPTLSYILDSYPTGTEFVITLGHFSEHVREFIEMAYPKTKITFVEVDKFDGPGSSLIYSMLKASNHLQEPFIYHASDTIVTDKPSPPKKNWIGGFKGSGSSNYASFDILDGTINSIHDKGNPNPDYLHVGWVGINNFKEFWKQANLLLKESSQNESLGDVEVIRKMLSNGIKFNFVPVKKWYDVGNIDSLNKVRYEIEDSFHILDKPSESIYFLNGNVVKFFSDSRMVKDRVKRAGILKNLVPKIESSGNNFYSYKHVKGDLMAEIVQPHSLRELLSWAESKLWKPSKEVSNDDFKKVCLKFYKDKTKERLKEFIKSRGIKDSLTSINGSKVPSAESLLKQVDFDQLSSGEQTHYHGDFVLDNILKTKDGFCLLDWRQNFGGLIESGDKYYDLAKLSHNLTVNHGIVNNNLFEIKVKGQQVKCDIMRKHSLVQSKEELFRFLNENKYDSRKVELLTAIIWLNMAPLHEHPLDIFLYYFGRLNLWYALKNGTNAKV